jgi:hypothetical protein
MNTIYFSRSIEDKLHDELIACFNNNDIDNYIKTHYNAIITEHFYIEFKNEKDYTLFVLKYGT